MSGKRPLTRRDFLKGTACGTAALAFGLPLTARAEEEAAEKLARVVLIRDRDVLDDAGAPNGPVLSRMLDQAVLRLFERDDIAACWRGIVGPADVLGIKSNVWRDLPTPPALEEALVQRALEAGVRKEKIAVADRGILDHPVFQEATALINIRPLRTHHWSGIGGCIKNYILFTRTPWEWHGDSCADLGGVWNLPVCKGKTRLNILVLLTPLFYGIGPHHFDPEHVWPYKGLAVSTDPVALDAIGVKLLAEKRRVFFDRPPRGGTSAKHVALADTRHGIGVADLERIELIRMGWTEDALIE